jgi:predicted DNA-binding antitoxin AbrB/MazE fold protein
MTKAVLKDGVFRPVGPVPADWAEGAEVEVELTKNIADSTDSDLWKAEMDRAVAEIDEEDARTLRDAIAEIRAEAKELARQGRM